MTQSTGRLPNSAGRTASSVRFGNGALEATLEKTIAQKSGIKNLWFANKINNFMNHAGIFNGDVRVGGMSLEDMAGRIQTLLGVYILQTYYAFKDEKHPWETLGRNAVVWIGTFVLTKLLKDENFGVNTLFLNPFMRQKGTPGLLRPVLDLFRMPIGYTEILEKSGIAIDEASKKGAQDGTKALWAASWLDKNRLDKVKNHLAKLENDIIEQGLGKLDETAKATYKDYATNTKTRALLLEKCQNLLKNVQDKALEDKLLMSKTIPSFLKRISAANLISTGLITAATVYVIGGLAMRFVYKFIAPFDKDFDPSRMPGKKKPQKGPQALQPGQPAKPAVTPPIAATPVPMTTPALPPQQPLQPAMVSLTPPRRAFSAFSAQHNYQFSSAPAGSPYASLPVVNQVGGRQS